MPHRYLHYLLAALLWLALPGCDNDPGFDHTYQTRAIVLSLPGERVTEEFIVHHEEIPHYRSINGSVGMREMAMPIPVPDKSILKNIAVGDKVQLTFGERFEPKHQMALISITKLPADAELNLNKAK